MCEKCNDSGYISWTERINNIDYAFSKVCKCRLCRREHERQEKHIKESGLNNLFDKLTFETYKAKNEVQTYIKEQAIAILEQSIANSWKGIFPLKDYKKNDENDIYSINL